MLLTSSRAVKKTRPAGTILNESVFVKSSFHPNYLPGTAFQVKGLDGLQVGIVNIAKNAGWHKFFPIVNWWFQ
jgi:hypothetical protein